MTAADSTGNLRHISYVSSDMPHSSTERSGHEETQAQLCALARRLGLRYVTADELSIRRRRCGRGWCYLNGDGRPIHDDAVLRRLARLAQPSARPVPLSGCLEPSGWAISNCWENRIVIQSGRPDRRSSTIETVICPVNSRASAPGGVSVPVTR